MLGEQRLPRLFGNLNGCFGWMFRIARGFPAKAPKASLLAAVALVDQLNEIITCLTSVYSSTAYMLRSLP
jgi:hypothetical protein